MAINFFNSISYLEPRCKNCNSKIDYGVTTVWNDDLSCHICLECRLPIEVEQKDIIIDTEDYAD